MSEPNGAPAGHFTWANLIALLALLVITFGGSWTLFQAQFSSLEKTIEAVSQSTGRNRDISIQRDEFREFEQRFDDLKRRIEIVESTRPTADTLGQAIAGVSKRVDALHDDLLALRK